jgi:hemerythrin
LDEELEARFMASIEWDDSLSVGITKIDDQHKMLIQKLNDLSDACNQKLDAQKIMSTLNFMIEYTDFHFSTEETNMAKFEYPGLAAHKEKHGEFVKVLKDLLGDFDEEGGTAALVKSIDTFLVNWLITHIKGTDVEFGKFLKEKGLAFED